ncbi:hypothetical protein RFI_08640 [Reticulomyxa filosa]|uniref:Uncharacterized protein n=1 Tax=Reticulomyxa filosa TaxID=46433 RepID=X6NQC3_RETFI|nr:hypothetical protein RFI_08640 [Reticulomyxa filosa]|eukprot:ETO28490.1 hypothetical protein RFI_08640 [Reticulomyxa filosa]
MNYKLTELNFIEDNKHCHLCSTDMAGPCAYNFRLWMGCASALDKHDRNDPSARYVTINKYKQLHNIAKHINTTNTKRQCCNSYVANNPEINPFRKFPWFIWAQRAQIKHSPCNQACRQYNPFSGRSDYLLNPQQQKCNQCLMQNSNYPWHAFTRMRLEECFLWKLLQDKIDLAEDAAKEAYSYIFEKTLKRNKKLLILRKKKEPLSYPDVCNLTQKSHKSFCHMYCWRVVIFLMIHWKKTTTEQINCCLKKVSVQQLAKQKETIVH